MSHQNDDDAEARRAKYGRLPKLVSVEDTMPSQETEPARDPNGGRDTDLDFTIRHAGG